MFIDMRHFFIESFPAPVLGHTINSSMVVLIQFDKRLFLL